MVALRYFGHSHLQLRGCLSCRPTSQSTGPSASCACLRPVICNVMHSRAYLALFLFALATSSAAVSPEIYPEPPPVAEICPSDYAFIGTAYWYRIHQKPECIYALKLSAEESRVQRDTDPTCEHADFIAVVDQVIAPEKWAPRQAILIRMGQVDRKLVWEPNSSYLFVVKPEETKGDEEKIFRLVKIYPKNATVTPKFAHPR